jgi:hypothetical protein
MRQARLDSPRPWRVSSAERRFVFPLQGSRATFADHRAGRSTPCGGLRRSLGTDLASEPQPVLRPQPPATAAVAPASFMNFLRLLDIFPCKCAATKISADQRWSLAVTLADVPWMNAECYALPFRLPPQRSIGSDMPRHGGRRCRAAGIVASLSRPGGNITGVSLLGGFLGPQTAGNLADHV